MTGSVSTAFCYSAKQELATGGHCFLASNVQTGNVTSTSNAYITGLTNTYNLAVGMVVNAVTNSASVGLVNGTPIVSRIINSTCVKLDTLGSQASSTNAGSITFLGDNFNMGLFIASPAFNWAGTANTYGYNAAGTPAANCVGTDEVASGGGYTTGGFALTNISPAVGTTAAYWSFVTNPSWTSATFSTSGGFIYNTNARIGCAGGVNSGNGRMISIHSFGGTQTVTAGTFTVVLPTNGQGTAILQIS